jgi:CheY-like chemotaxis protein
MERALILIIDTSAETRAIYGDYFRHHGYAVAQAADSAEAVRLYYELRPNLIVTELSEDPEWVQAIRTLRRPNAGLETPLIACSTTIDQRWPFPPPGIDVDVALPKPTSPRALLLEAQRLLARGPSARAGAAG